MALAEITRRVERTINRVGTRRKTASGWRPTVTGFAGFGSQRRVRVLGRVLMQDPNDTQEHPQRGWRQFLTIQVGDLPVTVRVGEQVVHSTTSPNGYIDVLVEDHGLAPGWHQVSVEAEGAEPVEAPVFIVEPDTRIGLISDIDDTVLVTWLPRALVAAWNSWIRHTNTRRPVPGMAEFYREMLREHPDAPVFYLSTGAWNTYESLVAFLEKHGLPTGPLLLTDWGPTPTGLFRSGQEHKKVQLRNLIIEYPEINWILVGDDGQHDPLIYGEAVFEHPDRIAGVAIRQLSPGEHVLSHGTTSPLEGSQRDGRHEVPTIFGADGHELLDAWRAQPFSPLKQPLRGEGGGA